MARPAANTRDAAYSLYHPGPATRSPPRRSVVVGDRPSADRRDRLRRQERHQRRELLQPAQPPWLTKHGRATSLLWHTALKSGLTGNRNEAEDLVLRWLREVLPEGVKVTVLADRGFGDVELFELLNAELGFDFVIRFRECIHVEDAKGVVRTAAEWAPRSGRATALKNATVTARRYGLTAVAVVKAPGMKDAWCLATSLAASASGAGETLRAALLD